jgi:two-component system chemotaxis response regulator CheB
VLVADDSATLRRALCLLLAEDPRVTVVGEAKDGAEAVRLTGALRPDVVTMDVLMPHLDGLDATAAIMATQPARVLVVCSVSERTQLDLSFRAMAAGALELIAKPKGLGSADRAGELRAWGRKLASTIVLMAEVPVVRRPISDAPTLPSLPRLVVRRAEAVGIAASTGGPPALARLLGRLPRTLPLSVLIAQHIADGFTDGLQRWLATVSPLPVRAARDGEVCEPGVVYLAPDGRDLSLGPDRRLRTPPATGPHRPSCDLLLRSLAESLGPAAAGVVLTGMGDDGAQGLLALRQAGGCCLAQDEHSCVVFGMPQAARDLGAAELLLPLDDLAARIVELA